MWHQWEHFEHGASIGVRGYGATEAAAFEQAAVALTAVVTDPSGVVTRDAVQIMCEAPDDHLLLAEWLNALIYEMAVRRMVFGRYQVSLAFDRDRWRLRGMASGELTSRMRHHPTMELKGATYTALNVQKDAEGQWVAQTVVDV